MKKRIISFILAMVMVIGFMPTFAFAANTTKFAGGSGTESDPYLIETKYHLNNVRNYLYAHFKMIADIEFTDADFAEGGKFYRGGDCWDPIGASSISAFTGTFDGDGHTIKNLYIRKYILSSSSTGYAGLFGYNNGTIKNLGMVDGTVSAFTSSSFYAAYAGGIAGYNTGTITICYNTGSVSSSGDYAGGIAGYNTGTITICYNTGSVSSDVNAGGIAGQHFQGTIENCYNTGTVSVTNSSIDVYVGGIAGYNSRSTIKNCYNAGAMSVSSFSSILNNNAHVGGNAGYSSSFITNCYHVDIIPEWGYNGGYPAKKCSVAEMKLQTTFIGFDFENIWTFDETLEHHPSPVLKNVRHIDGRSENTTEFGGGIGTALSPYLISNKTHLNNIRNYLSAQFKMTCDIEFTDADFAEGGAFYNSGNGWKPIGTFCGTFDGDGHTINNLYIKDASNTVGLFGDNHGIIKNLGVVDGTVSVVTSLFIFAGGIVGNNYGTIESCYNTGTVSATSTENAADAGGIAGLSKYGSIKNCYNTGKVSAKSTSSILFTPPFTIYGDAYAGGIAGKGGFIENCYNTGTVSATAISHFEYPCNAYAGGIQGADGSIANCYNTGTVSATSSYPYGDAYAGGIIGYDDNGIITNCYNAGKVSASYSGYYGGIVGCNDSNDTMKNCYHTMSKGVGSGQDLTTRCSLKSLEKQVTFTGFDFENVWTMTGSDCYLYPELQYVDFVTDHIYEFECDTICNCGYERTAPIEHDYKTGFVTDNHFDECTVCGNIANVKAHEFDNACDRTCTCGYSRTITHNHQPSYNTTHHYDECIICGNKIKVKAHNYDNACDTTCDCGFIRAITHDHQPTFDEDNHFDKCTVCGDVVNVKAHEFENNCDTTCDCGYERTITHSYGEYVYNNDATTKKDGTKTCTCSVCGDTETIIATGTKWKNPFTDVKKSDFYYEPVLWAVSNGITSGTSKTTFGPNEACTRGQIATFLWRAAGCPAPKTSKNPFTDVKKSDYYYKAVLWAVGEGITSGTSKTTFGPNEACTRGQIATFLWRANGGKKVSASNPFKDVKKSDYYYNAVLWAVKNKITSGTSATTFSPNEACTRGQIATFLYRNYN